MAKSTNSRSHLANLGAELISSARSSVSEKPIATPPVATLPLDAVEPRAVHIIPDREEDQMLTDLEAQFRAGGIPSGTNGINRSALSRFAIRQLHKAGITPALVKEMKEYCDRLRQERLGARASRRTAVRTA